MEKMDGLCHVSTENIIMRLHLLELLLVASLCRSAALCMRPLTAHHLVQQQPVRMTPRNRELVCNENEEVDRAMRRKDSEARRAEMEGASSISDDDMKTLADYISVVEDKEEKDAEIRDMLRVMQAQLGVQFVSDSGEILASAWLFVTANLLVAAYFAKSLLLDPIERTLNGGGGWPL